MPDRRRTLKANKSTQDRTKARPRTKTQTRNGDMADTCTRLKPIYDSLQVSEAQPGHIVASLFLRVPQVAGVENKGGNKRDARQTRWDIAGAAGRTRLRKRRKHGG